MRYQMTGPGAWDVAFRTKSSGNPGDMPVPRINLGEYLSPGAVTSPSTYYSGFGFLGQDTTTTDTTGTTDSTAAGSAGWLQNLITGITQYQVNQQQLTAISQINQINIQRAAAGLPPLPVPTLGAPSVNVGLSPQTQTLLIYGALGIGALILLNTLVKRRT
jgi:hypothetical protein